MGKFNFDVLEGKETFLSSHKSCLNLFEICIYISTERGKHQDGDCTHLHDTIPVVPR